MDCIRDPEQVRLLFADWKETIIWSCLEGCMGELFADHAQQPQAAAAVLGDFCFLAGKPSRALAGEQAGLYGRDFLIMVPQNAGWEVLIEEGYGGLAKRVTRYAMKKEEHVWDPVHLAKLIHALPRDYEIKLMDEECFRYAKTHRWALDWIKQFADYKDFDNRGLGVAVVKNGEPVSGAASYSVYSGGIEIEIDTREDYRRKGLASACGAALILECEKRGLYPGWDAQNPWSVALAEKLGYHFDHEYTAYEVCRKL